MPRDNDDAVAAEVLAENREWIESLDYVYEKQGPQRVLELLRHLQVRAQQHGVSVPFTANTPYINTIPPEQEAWFPGDEYIESRIRRIIRWNAAVMVSRANGSHFSRGMASSPARNMAML